MERQHVRIDQRGDPLHLLQSLDTRLGLPRLRRLGLEAIDEGLQVLALLVLLLRHLLQQHLLFGAQLLEHVVAAAVEHQLGLVEMQDLVDRRVQKVAVMADHQHRVRISGQVIHQPERAFEVEIVRRLVEQQQPRLREQHRGQCHAHPPAARKRRARTRLCRRIEAQPVQDHRGAGRGGMRVDIDKAGLDLGDPVRVGGVLGLVEQCRALDICGQHHFEEGLRSAGGLLGDGADLQALADGDAAALRRRFTTDHAEKGGLPRAIARDKTDSRAGLDRDSGLVEQRPRPEPVGKIVDVQHAGLVAKAGPVRKPVGLN